MIINGIILTYFTLAEMTHDRNDLGPKRPTPKFGRNDTGRNDLGRNDPGPKQPGFIYFITNIYNTFIKKIIQLKHVHFR